MGKFLCVTLCLSVGGCEEDSGTWCSALRRFRGPRSECAAIAGARGCVADRSVDTRCIRGCESNTQRCRRLLRQTRGTQTSRARGQRRPPCCCLAVILHTSAHGGCVLWPFSVRHGSCASVPVSSCARSPPAACVCTRTAQARRLLRRHTSCGRRMGSVGVLWHNSRHRPRRARFPSRGAACSVSRIHADVMSHPACPNTDNIR